MVGLSNAQKPTHVRLETIPQNDPVWLGWLFGGSFWIEEIEPCGKYNNNILAIH